MFALLEPTATVADVVAAFLRAESLQQAADSGPQRLAAAGGSFAQQCLELGEELLDRVPIAVVTAMGPRSGEYGGR
jgi:hypothetical protein